MSYYLRAGLVEENKAILELIQQALSNGEELTLDVKPERLYQDQWKLRRVLKATECYFDEAEGRYVGLGASVTVSTKSDWIARKAYLVIKLRRGAAAPQTNVKEVSKEDEDELFAELRRIAKKREEEKRAEREAE